MDIYSRYLSESAVFENREKSLCSLGKDLEKLVLMRKEAYGDGLDPDARIHICGLQTALPAAA